MNWLKRKKKYILGLVLVVAGLYYPATRPETIAYIIGELEKVNVDSKD